MAGILSAAGDSRRGERLLLAALAAAWLLVTLPLLSGEKTLILRDVLTTHVHLKAYGAAALAHGSIPAFNPTWALGQPFAGNPNALAFYPGNLLYLLLPFWSAFNAHYVLHWLLAFVAFRKLARELGQSAIARPTGCIRSSASDRSPPASSARERRSSPRSCSPRRPWPSPGDSERAFRSASASTSR